MKFSILRNALPDAKAALALYPDILAVGIGEKRSEGSNTRVYAFILFVENKRTVPDSAELPTYLELQQGRFPTDIRQLAPGSFRPVNEHIDGSDLLFVSQINSFGTLGVVGQESGGAQRVFGITNAHVVAHHDTSGVGAIISANTPRGRQKIGRVAYQTTLSSTALNTTDIALIELNALGRKLAKKNKIEPLRKQVKRSGPLSATTHTGGTRNHFYVTEELTGEKVNIPVSNFTEYGEVYYIDRLSQKKVSFGRGFHCKAGGSGVKVGHSGSVILRVDQNDDLVATGIIFAGEGEDAFAFSWTELNASFRSFGVVFDNR